MLVEPPDLPAAAVLAAVRAGWDLPVSWIEYVPAGAGAHHWTVGDGSGTRPSWFVTADLPRNGGADSHAHPLADPLVAALVAARALADQLTFVVAPEPARDGSVARPLGGYLLSVAAYLDAPRSARFEDDLARAEVAAALARLHAAPRPPGIPVWRPRVGRRDTAGREQLAEARAVPVWSRGPLGHRARTLLTEHEAVLDTALRRFDLLAAAVRGTVAAWVPTHGEPHAGNVLGAGDGPRLVGWHTLALAPRERDLRHVLLGAHGPDPELAYLANGGDGHALAPDVLELFALEWHLSEVAGAAVRLAGPHQGTPDDDRLLAGLAEELDELARTGR